MINAIEDIFMVNQIKDSANIKHIESDPRLKANHQVTKDFTTDATISAILDNVSLSITSRQLEELKASLQDLTEINEARVLYFKAEIQSGNYEIHSDKIANNMLNNLEMA